MRMDKLTSKFQMALADAQSLAVGQDHQFIEPAHVLIALLDQQGGSVRGLLVKSGVNVNLLRSQLGVLIDKLPKVEGAGGEVHVSQDLAKLFNLTDKLAQQRDDQYISSELFVLAALDDRSPLKSIFEQAGAVRGAVEKAIDDLRGGQQVDDLDAGLEDLVCRPLLDQLGRVGVDGHGLVGLGEVALAVERLAQQVEEPAQALVAHGHGNGGAGVDAVHAADQTVGRLEAHRADSAAARLLNNNSTAATGAVAARRATTCC